MKYNIKTYMGQERNGYIFKNTSTLTRFTNVIIHFFKTFFIVKRSKENSISIGTEKILRQNLRNKIICNEIKNRI